MCNFFCLYAKGSYCVDAVRSYLVGHAKDCDMAYRLAGDAKPYTFPDEFKKASFGLKPGVVYVAVCCFRGDLAAFDIGKVFLKGCAVYDCLYSQDPACVDYFRSQLRSLSVGKRPRADYFDEFSVKRRLSSWMDNASAGSFMKFGEVPEDVSSRLKYKRRKRSIRKYRVLDSFWEQDMDDIREYIRDEGFLYRRWLRLGGPSGTGKIWPAAKYFWLLYEVLWKSVEWSYPIFIPGDDLLMEMVVFFAKYCSESDESRLFAAIERWYGSEKYMYIRGHYVDFLSRYCCF